MAFNVLIKHPYEYLIPYVDKVWNLTSDQSNQNKEPSKQRKSILQYAWTFLNDSMRTVACLQYLPAEIAAGSVYLSCVYASIPDPETLKSDLDPSWHTATKTEDGKPWWQVFGIEDETLNRICAVNLEPYGDIVNDRLVELIRIYPTDQREASVQRK